MSSENEDELPGSDSSDEDEIPAATRLAQQGKPTILFVCLFLN